MEYSGVRFEEGTLRQTYSGTAWKRAMSKYSVDFEVNGSVIVPGSILRTTCFIVTARLRKERAFTAPRRS
jgi:hypothetical protein